MRCPSCGSGNREGAKFCNECAAPLPLRCLPSLHGTAVVIERAQDHPHRDALQGLSEGVCDLRETRHVAVTPSLRLDLDQKSAKGKIIGSREGNRVREE